MLLAAAATLQAADDSLRFQECQAGDPHASAVLVLDLRKPLQHAAFFIPAEDARDRDSLDQLLERCPMVPDRDIDAFLSALRPHERFISRRGDHITIYAFGAEANIRIVETVRNTAIRDDLADLMGMIHTLAVKGALPPPNVFRADYALREVRARAAVSIVSASNKETKVAEIITGPPEHFRISANVPVNTVKQLDYDEKTNTVKLRDTPREFMAGFDFFLGDVLGTPPLYDWRRLGVKALVRFSKEPLDAYGLMAAYRIGGMHVIAGRTWNRQTTASGNGYKAAWRVGLGFDLKTAKSWISR